METIEVAAKLLYDVYKLYERVSFDRSAAAKHGNKIRGMLKKAFAVIEPMPRKDTTDITDALICSVRMIKPEQDEPGLVMRYMDTMEKIISQYNLRAAKS